jgi:hypothetical protein
MYRKDLDLRKMNKTNLFSRNNKIEENLIITSQGVWVVILDFMAINEF